MKRTACGMPASASFANAMRRVALSRSALGHNLEALVAQHGPELVLDLRSNAYGCGIAEVGAIAREVGIRKASYSLDQSEFSALDPASAGAPAISGWWSGPAGAVLTFSATIVSLKRVPAATPVSYGYEYHTARETTLALMSAGFADGVPRSASGKASVGIAGGIFPIAGRIAMDQCVLDVGDHPASVGDDITVWGHSPTLLEWSAWSQRSEGALLTHLGSRVVKSWN